MSTSIRVHGASAAGRQIADLPDDLLCYIISFLPLKLAVKTSVVSQRWRYLWRGLNQLHLTHGSCMPPERSTCSNEEIIWGVSRVIFSQRNEFISSCDIFFSPDDSPQIMQQKLNWINFLRDQKNLQKLAIDMADYPYQMVWPPSFFKGVNLREVDLLSYSIIDAIPFHGCTKLRSLSLHSVEISGAILVDVVRNCKNLESLFLICCSGLGHIGIENQTLKHIEITYLGLQSFKLVSRSVRVLSISSFSYSSYDIRCPNLSVLTIKSCNAADILPSCSGLVGSEDQVDFGYFWKVKTLTSNFNLENWYDLILLRYIFRVWNCLQYLYIVNKSCGNEHPDETLLYSPKEFWTGELPEIIEIRLKVVQVECFKGSEKEMEFLSHIIKNAGLLEKLIIRFDISRVNQAEFVKRELLSLPRGSENAQIIFN